MCHDFLQGRMNHLVRVFEAAKPNCKSTYAEQYRAKRCPNHEPPWYCSGCGRHQVERITLFE